MLYARRPWPWPGRLLPHPVEDPLCVCWHPDHDSVTVEMVIGNLQKNAVNAQLVIQDVVRRLTENPPSSDAHSALKYAVLTPLDTAPESTKQKLKLLLEKYM